MDDPQSSPPSPKACEPDVVSSDRQSSKRSGTRTGAPSQAAAEAQLSALLVRIQEAIRSRHYSPNTERSYVAWIRRFCLSG